MTRILIVEDENFLAMELMWIVEDAGYSVVGPERSVAETRQVLASKKGGLGVAGYKPWRRNGVPDSKDAGHTRDTVRLHYE